MLATVKIGMIAIIHSQNSSMVMNAANGRKSKVWDYFKQTNVNGILKAECLHDHCKIQIIDAEYVNSVIKTTLTLCSLIGRI